MNRIVHAALIGLLLSAAGCSKGYDPEPPQRPPVPVPTVTIAEFQKLCLDGATVIREPIVLTGIVTTSDRSGNFYRTLGIEQNRSAVEIRTGTDNSHTRYPVGSRVCLRVQGLCVERQRACCKSDRRPHPPRPRPSAISGPSPCWTAICFAAKGRSRFPRERSAPPTNSTRRSAARWCCSPDSGTNPRMRRSPAGGLPPFRRRRRVRNPHLRQLLCPLRPTADPRGEGRPARHVATDRHRSACGLHHQTAR